MKSLRRIFGNTIFVGAFPVLHLTLAPIRGVAIVVHRLDFPFHEFSELLDLQIFLSLDVAVLGKNASRTGRDP